jgi:agmatinase
MMKTLDIKSNFLALDKKYSTLEHSAIVVVPAPFENSTSYGKGTANAPKAILEASAQVEYYDNEMNKEICFEKGIATLAPLNMKKKRAETALKELDKIVSTLIDQKKFVVTLGGEHTISIAPIKAYHRKYPNMSLLHFDAHADLRKEYQGSQFSHASAMARVCDFFPPERMVQVGIRALSKDEADFIRSRGVKTHYATTIHRAPSTTNWQENVVRHLGEQIYISFDVDYFDPAMMPATGTPEPDGFFWNETMNIFRAIRAAKKRIIGFDVVELSPIPKLHHCDLTVARLVYKMINYTFA